MILKESQIISNIYNHNRMLAEHSLKSNKREFS